MKPFKVVFIGGPKNRVERYYEKYSTASRVARSYITRCLRNQVLGNYYTEIYKIRKDFSAYLILSIG